MSSDYGDLCRDIKTARAEARAKHGVPCPECVRLLPRASPSILLPEQRCRIHGYRDPRQRTRETEYLHRVEGKQP
jgi:hypothetical protein